MQRSIIFNLRPMLRRMPVTPLFLAQRAMPTFDRLFHHSTVSTFPDDSAAVWHYRDRIGQSVDSDCIPGKMTIMQKERALLQEFEQNDDSDLWLCRETLLLLCAVELVGNIILYFGNIIA